MARSNKLCYRCLGRSHYGEACTKTRIRGINGCTQSLLHGNKFVGTNNEEDEKEMEAPSIIEGGQPNSNERSHTTTMHATKQPTKTKSGR